MSKELLKSISMRFLRAFAAGAVANMLVVLPFGGSSWNELGTWFGALIMSGFVGGITGLVMATDKFLRAQ